MFKVVCMYDYLIAASIKTLTPFEGCVCVYVYVYVYVVREVRVGLYGDLFLPNPLTQQLLLLLYFSFHFSRALPDLNSARRNTKYVSFLFFFFFFVFNHYCFVILFSLFCLVVCFCLS